MKKRDWVAVLALCGTALTLFAGPNIYQQATGRSFWKGLFEGTLLQNTVVITPTVVSRPQFAHWGLNVDQNLGPGTCLTYVSTKTGCDEFIPWAELEEEVETKLLPKVDSMIPRGSIVRLGDLGGKQDWVMEIVDSKGNVLGNVWFGVNPLDGWNYDGLVRVGIPSVPVEVWGTFQRYSDGSYYWQ